MVDEEDDVGDMDDAFVVIFVMNLNMHSQEDKLENLHFEMILKFAKEK